MKFVIPMPPNRANARGHWTKHHGDKKAYWSSLDSIQLMRERDGFKIPGPPKTPLTKAKASATMYVWAEMDAFNAGNRLKWLEDWLVTRGYIESDRMRVLQWINVPEQIIDRQNQRVELTLEEIL